jgi:tetratricopeptide (TPR) repeat protein
MNEIQLTKQMRTYYDNSDFLILIYTFEEYVNTIADDTELMFYAARSYDVNVKNTKAIKFYNKVIESQDPYYKVEAKWHLAKKYIDLNNKEKAKPLFEELVSSNSRYKSQAKDELKKIKQKENKNIKKNKNKRGNTNQLSSPIFH